MFPNNKGDTATASAFQFAIQLERFCSQMCVTKQAIYHYARQVFVAPQATKATVAMVNIIICLRDVNKLYHAHSGCMAFIVPQPSGVKRPRVSVQ